MRRGSLTVRQPTDYSAALTCGAGARKAASNSASRSFAQAMLASFTWPKPRMASGTSATSTASPWLSGGQARDQGLHRRLVLADQRALPAPLGAVAEDVERRPAQALELREQAEGLEHPGAEEALLQVAGMGIAPRR